MAFVTRVRLEAAGGSPAAVKAALDAARKAVEASKEAAGGIPNTRVTDEVYERIGDGQTSDGDGWYKGRQVVWLVQPNGPNDPEAKPRSYTNVPPHVGTGSASSGVSFTVTP